MIGQNMIGAAMIGGITLLAASASAAGGGSISGSAALVGGGSNAGGGAIAGSANMVGGGVVAVTGTITVTDGFANNRVYQRDAGVLTRSFTISGTYTDGPPTAIVYRTVRDSDGTPLSSWAVLDASPGGGTFSGTVDVPASKYMMNIEVAFIDNTSVNDSTANAFGIGVVYALAGQSNGFYWYTSGAENVAGNDGVRWAATGWADVDGFNNDGITAFANTLNDAIDLAVGVVAYSPSSTGLVAAGDSGSGYWTNFAGNPYTTFKSYVDGRTAGDLEGIIYIQGENEVAAGVGEATYQLGLGTLVTQLRADFDNHSGNDNLPVIIVEIGTHTTLGDAAQQAIRNAQKNFAAETADVFMSGSMIDLPLRDNVHYTNAAIYQSLAPRVGLVAAAIFDQASPVLWPRASYWYREADIVTVKIAQAVGASNFTPTSGIEGFEFLDDGTPITINSAVRLNGTTVRLTLASEPSGTEVLRYGYGANVIAPNALIDNQTVPFALESDTEIPEGSPPAGGTVQGITSTFGMNVQTSIN